MTLCNTLLVFIKYKFTFQQKIELEYIFEYKIFKGNSVRSSFNSRDGLYHNLISLEVEITEMKYNIFGSL